MKKQIIQQIRDLTVVLVGCILYAISFHWFFKSNAFVMGGFTGVAQILNRLIPGFPIGSTVFFMNLPLIFLFVKKEGLSKLWLTVLAIIISTTLIDLIDARYQFQAIEDLPAMICGGGLMGLSLGLLLRVNTTTGGTELAARLLQYRYRHLSIGRLCMVIDVSIIALYALVFRELSHGLYGAIAMVIAGRVIDLVVYGSVNAKLALIVSDRCDAIAQRLIALNMGATVMQAKGAYTGQEKNLILCVCKHPRLAVIKEAACREDPNAFFILCDAREVLGNGFTPYP